MPEDSGRRVSGGSGLLSFSFSDLLDVKNKRNQSLSDEEESYCSVGSSCIGSFHDISEYLDTLRDSWRQYLNNGDENIYDLMNGHAVYKVPATAVPKTEMELIFEERDAEEVLVNLGFAYQESETLPERFIRHEHQKTGRKFQITDLDGHFNAAVQDGRIPERYLLGDTRILRENMPTISRKSREITTIPEET